MEKNANFEFVPAAGEKYFSCDMMKGQVNGGQETVIQIKFTPPKQDALLKDIMALKGLGQWVESIWELKITGGYVEQGKADL
jgi:hypothetical protein